MIFGGFQRTTLIDYPGRVASIVFVAGCNMRCHYCHNPDLVFRRAPKISEQSILAGLESRKKYIDSVVVTGGEPTIWADLPDFLHRLKSLGMNVKLDTNGTNPRMLEHIVRDRTIDYIAMDVKAPWGKYAEIAGVGVDTEKVGQSLSIVKGSGIDYEFRTTLAPGLGVNDLIEIARQIRPARRWYLQRFVNGRIVNRAAAADRSMGAAEIEAAAAIVSTTQEATVRN